MIQLSHPHMTTGKIIAPLPQQGWDSWKGKHHWMAFKSHLKGLTLKEADYSWLLLPQHSTSFFIEIIPSWPKVESGITHRPLCSPSLPPLGTEASSSSSIFAFCTLHSTPGCLQSSPVYQSLFCSWNKEEKERTWNPCSLMAELEIGRSAVSIGIPEKPSPWHLFVHLSPWEDSPLLSSSHSLPILVVLLTSCLPSPPPLFIF